MAVLCLLIWMCLLTNCFVELGSSLLFLKLPPSFEFGRNWQLSSNIIQVEAACLWFFFFSMGLRNISDMWCLSVKITYFLAFCWRRTALPNHRSQLWMHHVLSVRAGKSGTRIWFHARISILSRPQTLSISVALLWLPHFLFTLLHQVTITCFLYLSLNFSYLLASTSFHSCLNAFYCFS